ncbi:GAF domain-containing protein [uncultured Jatrophihabitans sp.]|uniref:GAF domain-containing protein n=1 Tax=uncultured Jatrophihabitans sp. TaxID=1610747 RepID=UPI0035CC0768
MTTFQTHSSVLLPGDLPEGSRLQRVLDAYRLVTADLSSSAMLDRLLLAAVSLTRADYGAVAVLSPSGAVAQTVVHHAELAERASWRRVLEPLGDETGGSASAADRARAVGDARLLGVDLSARNAPSLELYVGVEDASNFDDEAAQLLQALAELAATAVENALLNEEAERSKDWLHASGEIARTLLSDADPDMVLQVVTRALHVAEADNVGLLLPDGDARLRVAVSTGRGGGDFRGRVIDADSSSLGRAALRGESMLVDDISTIVRDDYVNVHDFGSVMAAPLVDARGVRGSVVAIRRRGRPGFSARDLDLISTFADQLALALEMDDARRRGEWVKVLEDRHRIAKDLHDNVMQRLFAIGVGLQSMAGGSLPPDTARRLTRYISDLDETIDDIRTRVFGLRDDKALRKALAESRFPHVGHGEIEPTQ